MNYKSYTPEHSNFQNFHVFLHKSQTRANNYIEAYFLGTLSHH